jgi:hypothetical protein
MWINGEGRAAAPSGKCGPPAHQRADALVCAADQKFPGAEEDNGLARACLGPHLGVCMCVYCRRVAARGAQLRAKLNFRAARRNVSPKLPVPRTIEDGT